MKSSDNKPRFPHPAMDGREFRLSGAQLKFLSDIINHCLMDAEMYLAENETQLVADYYKKLQTKAQFLNKVFFPTENRKLWRKRRKDGPRKKRRF